MSIHAWNQVYYQLWTQAAQSRGTVTDMDDVMGPGQYTAAPEWPRTTRADAIAIASLVDAVFGTLPLRPGGYGIARLWQTAVIELEGNAFAHPNAEYVHNRSLWSTLLAVAAYLDIMDAPLPPAETLEALIAELRVPIHYRNASAPTTKTITESNAEKMWATQRDELMQARGFDLREGTAATPGSTMKIPRTTNADIVKLADYWAKQLAGFVPKAILGGKNTMGLEGQLKRWSELMADVDKLARKGRSDDVYPKNWEFWHESIGLATNLAVWEEAPSKFDLALDSTKQALSDLPGRIADAAGAVAEAVGHVAHEAGAGLLSGLGKPILIGGGVLLAAILLLRSGRAGVGVEV
ncbi:MAG: hypothetical protein ABIY55_20410 [Kofleriaceae bacterium]